MLKSWNNRNLDFFDLLFCFQFIRSCHNCLSGVRTLGTFFLTTTSGTNVLIAFIVSSDSNVINVRIRGFRDTRFFLGDVFGTIGKERVTKIIITECWQGGQPISGRWCYPSRYTSGCKHGRVRIYIRLVPGF